MAFCCEEYKGDDARRFGSVQKYVRVIGTSLGEFGRVLGYYKIVFVDQCCCFYSGTSEVHSYALWKEIIEVFACFFGMNHFILTNIFNINEQQKHQLLGIFSCFPA